MGIFLGAEAFLELYFNWDGFQQTDKTFKFQRNFKRTRTRNDGKVPEKMKRESEHFQMHKPSLKYVREKFHKFFV